MQALLRFSLQLRAAQLKAETKSLKKWVDMKTQSTAQSFSLGMQSGL